MRQRKILGYYIVNAAGDQVGWHVDRRRAQAMAVDYSKRLGGIYFTQPEYAEAA